ncbi:MAG: DUF934 domain-containing protein [Pseudomonadota bacterium]
MNLIIQRGQVISDPWRLLDAADGDAAPAVPAAGDVIVALATWRAQRDELLRREGRIGVVVDTAAEAAGLAPDLRHFDAIAIRFPAFTDGRGYSLARLLRERYGYRGELRAVGDVGRDQLYYLSRCGFDAFVLRPGDDPHAAVASLRDFSEAYQTAVDRPVPLFRRRSV